MRFAANREGRFLPFRYNSTPLPRISTSLPSNDRSKAKIADAVREGEEEEEEEVEEEEEEDEEEEEEEEEVLIFGDGYTSGEEEKGERITETIPDAELCLGSESTSERRGRDEFNHNRRIA